MYNYEFKQSHDKKYMLQDDFPMISEQPTNTLGLASSCLVAGTITLPIHHAKQNKYN